MARQAATARLLPLLTGGSVIPAYVLDVKRRQRKIASAAR